MFLELASVADKCPVCKVQVLHTGQGSFEQGLPIARYAEVAEGRQALKPQPSLMLWDYVEAEGGKLLEGRVTITQDYRALCGQWGGFYSGVFSINFSSFSKYFQGYLSLNGQAKMSLV